MPVSLQDFLNKQRSYQYKRGELVIRAGENPVGVFLIKQGFVKAYSITEEGDERLHIIYKPGEMFPLIWVFRDFNKDYYYEAVDQLTLKRVSKSQFLKFIKQNPEAALELIERIVSLFDIHIDRIDNLEITKAYPRLVARLLFLVQRFGRRRGKEVVIVVPITHKDIANSVNMTRETVSREMEVLEKKNLIRYEEHSIIIRSVNKLEQELSVHYKREPL